MTDSKENVPTPTHDMDTGTTKETDQTLDKRQWKLSEKGLELFQKNKNVKLDKIHKLWTEVEMLQASKWNNFKSVSILESYECDLSENYKVYNNLVSEYREHVLRSEEDEAMQKYEELTKDNLERRGRIENVFGEIQERKQILIETPSSHGSRSSTRSKISVIAKKQTKVKAARAKIKCSEHEIDLLEKFRVEEQEALAKIKAERRKAELNSSLPCLEDHKELTATEAEVEALKMAGSEMDKNEISDTLLPGHQESAEIRTNRFVAEHSHFPGRAFLNPHAITYPCQ